MNDEKRLATFEQIRRDRVDREVAQWSDTPAIKRKYSEYSLALDAITDGAIEYSSKVGASVSWRGEPSFERILDDAISLISNLRFAVRSGQSDGEDENPLSLWSHRGQPLYDVKAANSPSLSRPEIEGVVGDYLNLPYRARAIDRLLVDLLIALELYAYGNEVLNPVYIRGVTPKPLLKRSALLNWSFEIGGTLCIWIVIGLALWVLNAIGLFPESWLWVIHGVLALLFSANAAWATLHLPGAMIALSKGKKQALGLLSQMASVYSELSSDGPISARHIEQRARIAADAGVVWPGPLFALLDDINRRDGRF